MFCSLFQMSSAGTSLELPKTPTRREKEKKIGHRRVDDAGQVTYKKVSQKLLLPQDLLPLKLIS